MAAEDQAAGGDAVASAVSLLRSQGKDDVAVRIASVAEREPPARSVVVVGEIKRGKSSLVNSLLGKANLAAVDTEIATALHVRFVEPAESFPDGSARLILPGEQYRLIPAASLADWVTVEGAHRDESVDGLIPLGAEVAVTSPRFPHVTVIDTPGVNGLDPKHAEAAIAATDGACVLVMVCDALAPISSIELNFLAQISVDIGAVVLVVTKTDKALRQWNSVVEENKKLLTMHAPQFSEIPVIGVSNLLAGKAITASDGQLSEKLWAASRIPELAVVLNSALGDPAAAVRLNALQCAATGLSMLRSEMHLQLRSVNDAPKVHREMTDEVARLEDLKVTQREWSVRLTQKLHGLTLEIEAKIRRRFDELRSSWNEKISKLSVVGLNRKGRTLVVDIGTDIEALALSIGQEFAEALKSTAVDLVGETYLRSGEMSEALAGLNAIDLRPSREFARWKGFFDPQMITMSMAGGGALAALAAPLGAIAMFAPALIPLWGAFAIGFRARKFGSQELIKWLNEASRQAQEDVGNVIRITNNEFGPELRILYSQRIDASIAEAQRAIRLAEGQVAADRVKRNKLINQFSSRIHEIDMVIKQIATERGANLPAREADASSGEG